MKIIKLHTIDSTSSFLKELIKSTPQENFTVVSANVQTAGRGQMEKQWCAAPFKNLTFSVFVTINSLPILQKKHLNFAVSLAVLDALKQQNVPNLHIKWPNDILSENKKISGILIENKLQKGCIVSSVIGIGLNVNQECFANLPNASSLKLLTQKTYNLEAVLEKVVLQLKKKIALLVAKKFVFLEQQYLNNLYKYQTIATFKDVHCNVFKGKITGVSLEGKLQIELTNQQLKEFEVKQIQFV